MDAANAATEHVKADQIQVTWASTTSHERLSKIWAPEGEWEVTPGVKRLAYVFE
jgi:hypothetical protein